MDPITFLTEHQTALIPQQLVESDHWLIWQPIWSDPKEKYLKVPTTSSWQQLRQSFSSLPFPLPSGHGYGFIFAPTHNFICVDVDDGSRLNFRLVQDLNSYAEWSPSRKGAHVIISTDDKQAIITAFGAAAHNTAEKRDLFVASGYCTITGQRLPIYQDTPIRHIPHKDLIGILSPYFTVRMQEQQHKLLSFPKKATSSNPYPDPLVINTLSALPVRYLPDNAFIDFPVLNLDDPNPPEARAAWLTVGQALHNINEGNMTHLNLWIVWSQQGTKFDRDALIACWRSFGSAPSEITFATILKLFHAQRPQFVDMGGDPPRPKSTMTNIKAFMDFMKITGKHNLVTNELEISIPARYNDLLPTVSVKAVACLIDSELHNLGTRVGSCKQMAQELLISHALSKPYSPVQEYFDSLEHWDFKTRIPTLVNSISCVEQDIPQYTLYLRKWLIQVMAAVYTSPEHPNRLNNVLILQGDQGIGKTLWVESLFPTGLKQYCVGSKSISMSQFRNDMVKLNMELTNTLICNINEIDTVFNSKTYSEFKQFLDNTLDKIVLPYGSSPTTLLRRTVFIGSTNKYQIFSDHTGNRRFWLINAQSFNPQHNIDLDQLWAEALYAYKTKEAWWLEDTQAIKVQQTTNVKALRTMNEAVLDKLNNMFDPTLIPPSRWETYTFPRLTTLLGFQLRPNSEDFRVTKRTITQWLSAVAPGHELVKLPKAQGTPWKCRMPPVRTVSADENWDD